MRKKALSKIPVADPIISKNVKKYVINAIDGKALSGTYGNYIKKFETAYANFLNCKHAISVTNGTTALHTALKAYDIGKGDDVLVQSLTNMATAFAVHYTGAKIIPIDSEMNTCNISPILIEKKITKNTKAIIVVHLFGHPVDMDPIIDIAKKYNLIVIEDCAEAHGAKYKNKHLGVIGDIGCYSFYANKILSIGEGGMVVTNNYDIAEKCNNLKSLYYGKNNRFNHDGIGYNYRMSNLLAAVGYAQLEDIEKIIKKKRSIAHIYNSEFKQINSFILPLEQKYAFNVYWVYHVICRNKLKGKRKRLMDLLSEDQIETRESFWPINKQNVFSFNKKYDCPNANFIGENGFYLPSGPNITKSQINKVIVSVKKAVKKIEYES